MRSEIDPENWQGLRQGKALVPMVSEIDLRGFLFKRKRCPPVNTALTLKSGYLAAYGLFFYCNNRGSSEKHSYRSLGYSEPTTAAAVYYWIYLHIEGPTGMEH